MSYIGKQPTKAALTASDIEDGIITAAKIEDGTVVAAEIASNAVTTAKINADAVTSAKIADNAVVTAAINADAVTAAKIADDAISEEHLDVTAITGHTAETTVNDSDLVVIHDASASALRKMTVANLTANAGVAGISSSADATAMTITSAEKIGIGETSPLALVHIKQADSGQGTVSADTSQLVIEDDSTAGITLLGGTSGTGAIFFGDSGDNDIGQMVYDHSTNDMAFTAGGSERLRLEGTGPLSTGGETAADVHAGGICLDSNTGDGNYITFKSSDYGHGVTDWAETDTGFVMSKSQAGGGVSMVAINDGQNENIFNFTSIMGEANTTVTNTSSGGNFLMSVYRKSDSGTGTQAVADNGNAWVMRNNNAARLIFKGDGEIHSDTGSTTYDAYEDAQLVRAFDLSHGVGVINSKFDKFISYNHEKLADLGLVGRDEDGTPNHFTNITGMQKLHNGAIWQQYEKHNRLLEAVYELASESVGKEKADAILDKHDIKLLQ